MLSVPNGARNRYAKARFISFRFIKYQKIICHIQIVKEHSRYSGRNAGALKLIKLSSPRRRGSSGVRRKATGFPHVRERRRKQTFLPIIDEAQTRQPYKQKNPETFRCHPGFPNNWVVSSGSTLGTARGWRVSIYLQSVHRRLQCVGVARPNDLRYRGPRHAASA